jgi:hypothetical protein
MEAIHLTPDDSGRRPFVSFEIELDGAGVPDFDLDLREDILKGCEVIVARRRRKRVVLCDVRYRPPL